MLSSNKHTKMITTIVSYVRFDDVIVLKAGKRTNIDRRSILINTILINTRIPKILYNEHIQAILQVNH